MPSACCVDNCRARSTKDSPISLHRFPKNLRLIEAWRNILQIGPIQVSSARVCGNHFSTSQYDNYESRTLKFDAFPDAYLPRKRAATSDLSKRSVKHRLLSNYVCDDVRKRKRGKSSEQTVSALVDKENCPESPGRNPNDLPQKSRQPKTYSGKAGRTLFAMEQNMGWTSFEDTLNGNDLYMHASMLENVAREEIVGEEFELSETTTYDVPDHASFSHNFLQLRGILDTDSLAERQLFYLSGLTKSQFEFVYELCIDRQTEWCFYGLALREQLLLTFIKYRHAWEYATLSIIFKIKASSARDIFIFWTSLLYNRLETIDFWCLGSRCDDEYIAILDCTEIPIEKPTSPDLQQVTFSKYKNTNTFKVLVAIDEQGTIIFVSDAYGGSVSDNRIVELSGIIDLLSEGDHILADRGFEQTDNLSDKGIVLNRPPNKKGDQLSENDVFRTRAIAARRIDVERVIGYAKTYKILSQKVKHYLFPYMDKIIKILFKLTNFRPPICKVKNDRLPDCKFLSRVPGIKFLAVEDQTQKSLYLNNQFL